MRYYIDGQVNYISDKEKYNKQGDEKIVIAITQANGIIPNRIETIPFDFLGKASINLVNSKMVGVGDIVSIGFELRGRKYVPEGKTKPNFYLNLEGLEINIL